MKRALSGIEYLLICMQENQGLSQDYYLRRLAIYTLGIQEFKRRGSPRNRGISYFNRASRYNNVLWTDLAPKLVKYESATGNKMRPKKSQMYLTIYGWNRANEARKKIGLSPYIRS